MAVALDHFRNTLTLILDILKVFHHILLLWIGIWVHYLSIVRHRHVLWCPFLGTNHTTMTKLRLGTTSDLVHFIIIPIESVWKPFTVAGSHNATMPYHAITLKRVGCGRIESPPNYSARSLFCMQNRFFITTLGCNKNLKTYSARAFIFLPTFFRDASLPPKEPMQEAQSSFNLYITSTH